MKLKKMYEKHHDTIWLQFTTSPSASTSFLVSNMSIQAGVEFEYRCTHSPIKFVFTDLCSPILYLYNNQKRDPWLLLNLHQETCNKMMICSPNHVQRIDFTEYKIFDHKITSTVFPIHVVLKKYRTLYLTSPSCIILYQQH